MKPRVFILLGCFAVSLGFAQGTFQNLNFESANVAPLPSGQQEFVSVSDGLPGWQAYWGLNPAVSVVHNGLPLGSVATSILGPTFNSPQFILEGNFSAVLSPGADQRPEVQALVSSGIAQTGLVPPSSQLLFFKARPLVVGGGNNLIVSLANQTLNYFPVETTPNYTLYGANISAYAGQVGELRFTALYTPGMPLNSIALDGIGFSPVPEPSTWALLALGTAAFCCAARRRRK